MDARAGRVAAGAGAALLGILALVLWRSDALAGGWLWALRATALLAVAGLLGSTLLAGRHGTAPAPRREVVVRVPPTGAAHAQVRPVAQGPELLRRALLLAVLSAAPVLVVLALAPGASRGADPAAGSSAGAPAPASSAAGPAVPPPAAAPGPSPPAATGPPAPAATGPPAPAALGSAGAPAPGSCRRTVVEGDTLWDIAAEQLGPGATRQQVVDRWHAVYARNAAGVGADPDLIRPGLVLSSCG